MKSTLAGLSAACLVLASVASTQTPRPKNPVLSFGSDVSIIAVPVFVSNKDGAAIAGLTKEDFEIQDGGKPVAIESFLEVTSDTALTPPPGSEIAAPAMRRQFLLLFDLDFSRPMNVERSRRAALEFVTHTLEPKDLVAVGTVHPSGFRALVGFTPDKRQAAFAISSLGLGGAGRIRDPLSLVYDAGLGPLLEGRTADTGVGGTKMVAVTEEELRDQAVQLGRAGRDRYARHVEQFLAGFHGLARTLDSIKGRKQIILFSEGFDGAVLSGATGADRRESASAVAQGRLWEVDSESHFGSATGQTAMVSLFEALRGSDVVVHAVDVRGLGDTVNFESQEGEGMSSQVSKNTLAEFAENSGGRFIRAANNIEAGLNEVMAANRSFYVLAFTPASAERGKPRKLSVKVKRPGASVWHRATYTLPDPKKADPGRAMTESAEIIAKGVTGGNIKVSAYALPYLAKGSPSLSVVIQVAGDSLGDASKRKAFGLQVFGYAVDAHGEVLDYLQATPTIDPAQTSDMLKKSGVQLITTFAAAQGAAEVRLLVRDPSNAKWGALRLPVDVPAFSDGDTFVSAPMVVDDPFARIALPTTTQRRPNRDIPFRLDDRPFTVDADPLLKRGASREICVYVRPSAGANPGVAVALVGPDGTSHAQKVEKLSVRRDADGFDRVAFFLSPEGVPPGAYALSVSLAGKTAASPVRIE